MRLRKWKLRHLRRTLTGLAVLACALAFFQQPARAEALKAETILIVGDDSRTRIVINFDKRPEFSIHYLQAPNRTIIDIPSDVSFEFSREDAGARGIYDRVRYGAMSASHSRIVLSSEKPTSIEHAEVMENEDGNGFRLVIDGTVTSAEKLATLVKSDNWHEVQTTNAGRGGRIGAPVNSGHSFVIAVDAGHGGIDTGAIARQSRTAEKDITLAFAKTVADEFNKKPGFKAFLTRSEDVFLSLSERVRIARQNGANLLISLHADTLRQNDIRGTTVYTISEKASDRLADELAHRENTSDEIAGVVPDDASDNVSDILIDLTRRETQAFSENLAQTIVKEFEGQINLINNPHRYAGFRVLRAPDVPSVLIELGFLSNAEDDKLLKDDGFREQVAKLLVEATSRYKEVIGQ